MFRQTVSEVTQQDYTKRFMPKNAAHRGSRRLNTAVIRLRLQQISLITDILLTVDVGVWFCISWKELGTVWPPVRFAFSHFRAMANSE